jgi:hypothetical protein
MVMTAALILIFIAILDEGGYVLHTARAGWWRCPWNNCLHSTRRLTAK